MNDDMGRVCIACRSVFPSYIIVYDGNKGDSFRFCSEDMSALIFILEGSTGLSPSCEETGQQFGKYMFFLLPMGKENTVTVTSDSTRLLLYKFKPDALYCIRHFLNGLDGSGESPESNAEGHSFLRMSDKLYRQLALLPELIGSRKYCSHYYDLKVEEMFIYLNEYYSKNVLSSFFRPLLGGDFEFKSFVFANYRKTDKVSELAEKKGMTTVTFNRHFLRTFGVSASTWLKERRKDLILRDIKLTEMSFTELAFKYGFSSSAYFTTFCKKNWHKTPSELRMEH